MTDFQDPTSADACLARMKADEAATAARIASGETLELVPLEELDDDELQAIVKMARSGGNELMQKEGREAEEILANRAERA
jgi:hypothetical protein